MLRLSRKCQKHRIDFPCTGNNGSTFTPWGRKYFLSLGSKSDISIQPFRCCNESLKRG